MPQEYTLMHDIVSAHTQRMQNLKRYYPFFKLSENTLAQYKDGRYDDLDMGYIVLAVLRFFIEENHFNDRNMTYGLYEAFMWDFLSREFELKMDEDEMRALIQYIFDKLCNDGRPFICTYYDPVKKTRVRERVKLIDSRFSPEGLVYFVTSDAIEFYLDTKEVKDESKLTTEQLLLEKLIRLNNFGGALDVIRRINSEVGCLMVQKDEVLVLLNQNVFEGSRALESFFATGLAWFKEEQRLFAANKALVDKALAQTAGKVRGADGGADKIQLLDQELKLATRRHSDLLAACTQLQIQADELIKKAKHSRFRRVFSFDDFLDRLIKSDDPKGLEAFAKPLMDMNTHKTLNLFLLDDMLEYKPDVPETGELTGAGQEQLYVYEDELAQQRIENNFDLFLKVLFEQLESRGSFDLKQLNHLYEMKFTDNVLKNGDYFSFIVHLSQKNTYELASVASHQDTFLEGIMAEFLKGHPKFSKLSFNLDFISGDLLTLASGAELSNIHFQRRDR